MFEKLFRTDDWKTLSVIWAGAMVAFVALGLCLAIVRH